MLPDPLRVLDEARVDNTDVEYGVMYNSFFPLNPANTVCSGQPRLNQRNRNMPCRRLGLVVTSLEGISVKNGVSCQVARL